MTVDLTTGKPAHVLMRFAFPMMVSVLLQHLYVLVDLFIVGNCIASPETAVSAVAAASSVTNIYTAVAVGFNTGCSVLIAKFFGGKRIRDMQTAVRSALLGAAVIGLFLTLLGEIFCEPLLHLIDTPETAMEDAVAYLRIYTASLLVVFLYNIGTGICNAMGDSKTPLLILAVSAVGNVLLDLLFVAVLHYEVRGAAWATLLAQVIATALLLFILVRRLRKLGENDAPWVQLPILRRLLSLSLPTVLQQSFIAVGNFLIQRVIDGLGTEATVAGFSTALKVNSFAIACLTTMSTAIASFTAQNVGAGQRERVNKGFSAGVKMLYCIIVPVAAVFCLCAPFLVRLFLNIDDPSIVDAAVEAGSTFLRIVSPFYLVVAVKLASDGILRGHGAMRHFIISTVADLVLRVALSYLLAALGLGVYALPIAWVVGWIAASSIAGFFYRRRVWERKTA